MWMAVAAATPRHRLLTSTGAVGSVESRDMRLLLFAGFLGSGKTTLILSLAKRAAEAGLRISVIVNEVGEVGIDGEVLRMGDLQVKELTSGCICCQIGADLVTTLRELEQQFRPQLVIVEASGIATPAGVFEALHRYPVESVTDLSTLTVVDPTRLEALLEVLTPLIESQMRRRPAGGDETGRSLDCRAGGGASRSRPARARRPRLCRRRHR